MCLCPTITGFTVRVVASDPQSHRLLAKQSVAFVRRSSLYFAIGALASAGQCLLGALCVQHEAQPQLTYRCSYLGLASKPHMCTRPGPPAAHLVLVLLQA